MQKVRFRYLPYLDGLRAVSILLVMAFHGPGEISNRMGELLAGWAGVDVFFVISGFLITSLLLQEEEDRGRFSFTGFYMRRWLRIAPAYYFFLAAMLLIKGTSILKGILISAVYLTNYDVALGWGFTERTRLEHTWSLAIEEQFYLLWPLALLLMGRRALGWTILAILGVQVWKVYLLASGVPWLRLTGAFDTRVDCILVGCLVALLWVRPEIRERIQSGLSGNWSPIVLAIALLCSSQTLGHPSDPAKSQRYLLWLVRLPLHMVLVALLILSMRVSPGSLLTRLLSTTPLVWLGRLSYSLYLWHVLAFHVVKPYTQQYLSGSLIARLLGEVACMGAAIGVAALSYYVIEIPFLRLKKYWEPQKASRVAIDVAVAPRALPAGGIAQA